MFRIGFNGGGGGALPNHEHTNLPLDGGPLDFINTTIASLNQGSITYSDGAALQELVKPAVPAGEVLTYPALATAPSWQAGAVVTSVWTQLGNSTTIAAEGGFDVLLLSGLSITLADYAEVIACATIDTNTNDWGARVNGDTGNNYSSGMQSAYVGGAHQGGQASVDKWFLGRWNIANGSGAMITIRMTRNDFYSDRLQCTSSASGLYGSTTAGGTYSVDTDTLTDVSICMDAQDLTAGEITLYGIRKT